MNGLASTGRLAAKSTIRAVSSRAVGAVGVDFTEEATARTCLVVAPHPDDETFGCGATIARMRAAGTDVHVIFVSRGGLSPGPPGMSVKELMQLRTSEAFSALAILGVSRAFIQMMDFEDGALSGQTGDIVDALTESLRATSPEQVLVTSSRDRHPDHTSVAQATMAALSRSEIPAHLYEYPIWQRVPAWAVLRDIATDAGSRWTHGANAPRGRPRLASTDGFLAQKREAIGVYTSQLPHFPVGFVDDFLLPYEEFADVPLRQTDR